MTFQSLILAIKCHHNQRSEVHCWNYLSVICKHITTFYQVQAFYHKYHSRQFRFAVFWTLMQHPQTKREKVQKWKVLLSHACIIFVDWTKWESWWSDIITFCKSGLVNVTQCIVQQWVSSDFDAFFGAMLDCVVPNFLASNVSSALLPTTIVIEHWSTVKSFSLKPETLGKVKISIKVQGFRSWCLQWKETFSQDE